MLPLTAVSLAARGLLETTSNNSDDGVYVCKDGVLTGIPMSVRIVVGVTCVLSMIGAVLIVLSYILIRDIRTKAREILVNLSLMDFMVATANLIGIFINSFTETTISGAPTTSLCLAQASFAMYGTISSVLWTICVAVYVFVRIMLENSKWAQRAVYGFYVICYGVPLIMTLWFSLTGKLGNDDLGGSGWCSLITHDHNGPIPFNVVFGNDMWIYLTIILVPLIFISLHFNIRHQVCCPCLSYFLYIAIRNLSISVYFQAIHVLRAGEGWENYFDSKLVERCSKCGAKTHINPNHLHTAENMELAAGIIGSRSASFLTLWRYSVFSTHGSE